MEDTTKMVETIILMIEVFSSKSVQLSRISELPSKTSSKAFSPLELRHNLRGKTTTTTTQVLSKTPPILTKAIMRNVAPNKHAWMRF